MKNNKKYIIVVIICALLVGMFALLNTYALWRVSKSQTDKNVIKTACLKINYLEESDTDFSKGFNLTDTWPISDEEGIRTKGYTFKLENTCDEKVDFEIVLESLKTINENYFDDKYIKVKLNDSDIVRYSELKEEEKDSTEDKEKIRNTKILLVGSLPGKGTDNNENIKTYTLKSWISSDAGNEQIGKEFESRIKVYAGQKVPISPDISINGVVNLIDELEITNPSNCYTFDETTKTVTDYDIEKCGTELILPSVINGYPVERIELANNSITSSLTNVNLENARYLKEIGERTFYYYQGTDQELKIPNNVTKIGDYAFRDFSGINVTLDKSLVEIGEYVFVYYNGTNQELVIPDSVKYIKEGAFGGFNGPNLILSSSLITIGKSAFVSYQGINQELIIPDNVTSIGDGAFRNFKGPNLVLNNSLTTIGLDAFYKYQGTNQELIIPDNVTSIGDRAFNSFNGPNLVLGHSLTTIGKYAFINYKGINQELIIPDNVTIVADFAFYRFGGTNLILGRSLTGVYQGALSSYQGIININMSEAAFSKVRKSTGWKNSKATLNYLVN